MGKPLLRLLELYVLWSISRLSQEDEATLQTMAPKLQQLFGGDGTWQKALGAAMHMPDDMPRLIRENWEKNLTIAAENGVTLAPQRFAEMFVDSNFAP